MIQISSVGGLIADHFFSCVLRAGCLPFAEVRSQLKGVLLDT